MAPLRSPVPLEDIEHAARPVDIAVGLPPACYTDADFYRFEKAAVFDTEWLCVGRSSQIPEPGDYFTATLLGEEPVIVVRNRDGRIDVMSSICRHRAMCITAPAEKVEAACGLLLRALNRAASIASNQRGSNTKQVFS